MSNLFEEEEFAQDGEMEENFDQTDVIDGSAPDGVAEITEEEARINVVKVRRKAIQNGEEALKEEDFHGNTADWEEYQSSVEMAEKMASGNEATMKFALKSLVVSKGDYNKYLPGKKGKKSSTRVTKQSKIAELNELNRLAKLAHDAFEKWADTLKEIKVFEAYLEELGITEESTYEVKNEKGEMENKLVGIPNFQPYWAGLNPVKYFIKQNFNKSE